MSEPVNGPDAAPGRPRQVVSPNAAGMPRWVKVSLLIVAVLVVVAAVLLLTGHGPARHLSMVAWFADAAAGSR